MFAATTIFTSCSNKKENATRSEQIEEFRRHLTSKDTLAMLSICDEAMEQLKQKNYEQVLSNLFEYNDSTKEIKPLSERTAKRYDRIFKMFPVKYEVTFADADHTGTGKPATTMYMFNPVRVNGEWKLCVKTASDEFDTEKQ